MCLNSLSCVQLFVIPWTTVRQALLTMEFSRQEYWNGLPFPSPGHLPNPGIKPGSPTLQADSLPSKPPGNPQNAAMEMLKSMFWCTSPGQDTGMGCHFLLQGIFPTQGSNPCLLLGRQIITEPPGKLNLTLHILYFLYDVYSFMQHITKSLSNSVQNHSI